MRFGLGYKPDVPDARDQHFAKLGIGAAPPSSASLREYVVEVLDQGSSSACVAFSWAQALRIADKAAGIASPALSSVFFLYYNSRAYDQEAILDQGTQLRSCAKGLTKFGRPPESAWPFDMRHVNERPSWEAYREGYDHKGPAGYQRITTLTEIKQAIAAGHAVVGGVQVGESFEDYSGGIYSRPNGETSIGGHAMCLIGYDEQSFTLVNSWGALTWGDRGFARVAPSFVNDFTDLWCVGLK